MCVPLIVSEVRADGTYRPCSPLPAIDPPVIDSVPPEAHTP